jgi:calcineurin-like phosphoesterase family protein
MEHRPSFFGSRCFCFSSPGPRADIARPAGHAKIAIEIWFTADKHLGHANIIKFAKRPFSCVEEMDDVIIQRHNERVKNADTVYDLGDFAFADHNPYLRRLIDHEKRLKYATGWQSIEKLRHIKNHPSGIFLVLCHYALRVWDRSHHGAIHLYGHSHGNLPGDSQSCDVGVDCWDFYPVNLDEILERLADPYYSRPRGEPDHHQPKEAA